MQQKYVYIGSYNWVKIRSVAMTMQHIKTTNIKSNAFWISVIIISTISMTALLYMSCRVIHKICYTVCYKSLKVEKLCSFYGLISNRKTFPVKYPVQ